MFAEEVNWQDLSTTDWVAAVLLLLALFVLWLGALERVVRKRQEPTQPVPWNAPTVLLSLLAQILLPAICVFLAMGCLLQAKPELSPGDLQADPLGIQIRLTAGIVGNLLLLVGIWIGLRRQLNIGWRDLGWNAPTWWRDLGLGVAAFVAFIPIGGLVLQVVEWLFKETAEEHPLITLLQEDPGPGIWLTSFVLAVLTAPLVEELIFRVLLQGYLEKREGMHSSSPGFRLPRFASLLIASGIFAALHPWPSTIPLFLFALVLGYLYRLTHRLLPCVIAHTCLNLSTFVQLWIKSQSS